MATPASSRTRPVRAGTISPKTGALVVIVAFRSVGCRSFDGSRCSSSRFGSAQLPRVARADLDEYVKKPDSAFAWSQASSVATKAGVITSIKLTSQVWQGITWSHDLRVYEPREIVHPDAMLLFITGGDTSARPPTTTTSKPLAWRQVCGARVAVLPQVPNQPLLGRQDRRRADRRDVRPLPRRPKMRTGRCSSRWSRVPSRPWTPFRHGPRRTASP